MSHPVNVASMLARAARRATQGGASPFRELDELTARLGSALLRRGLVRGAGPGRPREPRRRRRPAPGVEVRIVDVVMRGYWRFDERGRLHLLDRKGDTIISGGTNIYPREVEEVLVAHPGVEEAVVFGVPDELWGESVVATVVVAAGAEPPTEDELIAHCRARIASFKKPRRVLFAEELPKNAYGTVLRRQVRDDLAALP